MKKQCPKMVIRRRGDPDSARLVFDVTEESPAAVLLTAGKGPLRTTVTLVKMPDGSLENTAGTAYEILRRAEPGEPIEHPVFGG